MTMPLQRTPERATGSVEERRLGTARDRRGDQSPERLPVAVLDLLLELLEGRRLSPTELRILVAALESEVAVSSLEKTLGRAPAEIRRTAARLYARGLIGWRDCRDSNDAVFAITRAGVATLRPLLTAAGRATLAAVR